MKTKIVVICCLLLIFCGCLQSKEHLTINKDGSGTLETNLIIPEATTQVLNTMLGGMMQAMSQAFGAGDTQLPSVVDQMFGNKEKILRDAQKAGLDAEFLAFEKETINGDLHINYTLKIDDIKKLPQSGIIKTKFNLAKDPDDNLILFLEKDLEKMQESKMQFKQFEEAKDSDLFSQMPAETKKNFFAAMENLEMEFIITMPSSIEYTTGMFEKIDSNSARMLLSGDILNDPFLIPKLYGQSLETTAISCSAQNIEFASSISTTLPFIKKSEGQLPKEKTKPKEETQTQKAAPEGILKEPKKEIPIENISSEVSNEIKEEIAEESEIIQQEEISQIAKEEQKEEMTSVESPGVKKTKIYLNNGQTSEGELIEETDEYIKIKIVGVPVTFYKDEISGSETFF